MKNDYELIGRSIVDAVAEPLRPDLVPGFDKVKKPPHAQRAPWGGNFWIGANHFLPMQRNSACGKGRYAIQREFTILYES